MLCLTVHVDIEARGDNPSQHETTRHKTEVGMEGDHVMYTEGTRREHQRGKVGARAFQEGRCRALFRASNQKPVTASLTKP